MENEKINVNGISENDADKNDAAAVEILKKLNAEPAGSEEAGAEEAVEFDAKDVGNTMPTISRSWKVLKRCAKGPVCTSARLLQGVFTILSMRSWIIPSMRRWRGSVRTLK